MTDTDNAAEHKPMSDERLAWLHANNEPAGDHTSSLTADEVAELLDEVDRLRARIAELGDEWGVQVEGDSGAVLADDERAARRDAARYSRYHRPGGEPSAYYVVRREVTPWRPAGDTAATDIGKATGGTISADTPPPALGGGCAWPTRSLEQLTAEQGVKPVLTIRDLTAAPEDRIPEAERDAFLAAIRRDVSSNATDTGKAQR